MLAPRLLPLAALAAACLACQASAAPLSEPSASAAPAVVRPIQAPLPPARQAAQVRVEGDSNDTLAELVEALGASTGVAFTMTEDVRSLMSQTRSGVAANVEIPADQLWSWVEGLLLHHGYYLSARTTQAPFLVGVANASGRGGPLGYLRVDASELSKFSKHKALLLRTTLSLPHTDVRQLGNSLRAITASPSGSQMAVPVGNTSSIILSGPASQVLELVSLLKEIDGIARAEDEKSRAAGKLNQQQPQAPVAPESEPAPPPGAKKN